MQLLSRPLRSLRPPLGGLALGVLIALGAGGEGAQAGDLVTLDQMQALLTQASTSPPATMAGSLGVLGQEDLLGRNDKDLGAAERQRLTELQYNLGLEPDGHIGPATREVAGRTADQIKEWSAGAADLLSRLPRQGRLIVVNIPTFTLYAVEDGRIALTSRVIAGKPARPTPRLSARLTAVKLNPDWSPPPTILRKDLAPQLRAGRTDWLLDHGMEAVDADGNLVEVTSVTYDDWAAGRIRFRQPPGEDNALGVLKFELAGTPDIYLHDTNQRDLFGRKNRALSSGCIRVEQWRALAAWVLDLGEADVDAALADGETAWRRPKASVPVHIVYAPVFPRLEAEGTESTLGLGLSLGQGPDVYHRGAVEAAKPYGGRDAL